MKVVGSMEGDERMDGGNHAGRDRSMNGGMEAWKRYVSMEG